MKQGKAGRLCLEGHPLLVGVVLVALFWVIESVLETFVPGEGNLLSVLVPAQPGQTWDRGLLLIVLLILACYAQRGRRSERLRIEGPCCSMGSTVEAFDTIVGRTLGGLITSWDRIAQSTCGCAVENLIPLELSATYQPCSRRSGEEISWAALKPCGSGEEAAGATSPQPFPRLKYETG